MTVATVMVIRVLTFMNMRDGEKKRDYNDNKLFN